MWTFREAFRIAQEGRPGPVLIDLPLDVQNSGLEVDFDPSRGGPLHFEKPAPRPGAIRQVVEMILEAERPVLMPGGGTIIADASEELVDLAEHLQVPVSPTYMGKGTIPEDHPLYMGIVGLQTNQRYANALFLESDLVVGIGNRWGDRHTGDLETYRGNRKFVHIDIEPSQIGRVFPPDLAVVSDAKFALQEMLQTAHDMTPAREPDEWVERVDELRSTLLRKTDFDDVPVKPQRVYQEINEYFDEDTVFVTAIGLYQIFGGQFQKTYKPRHYLCCGQAGPLGWEVPACIGVKLRPAGQNGGRGRRRLLLPVPHGGDCRSLPVQSALRARDAQQRLHGPDPAGRAQVRYELRRGHRLRWAGERVRHRQRRYYWRRWAPWVAG